ncbi:MAG: hypothetical protein EA391_01175 [Balneolaceae bacterium]|nr:MAG: hypothetical protein EA391_01175 [Balneolaceae bacterium]
MHRENTRIFQRLVLSARISLGISLLMVLLPATALSQSSSQVSITGIPSILPTPFADDLENNFISGQYQISFTYTSQFNQPIDFIFDFVVRKDGRAIIDLQSEPRAFTPGTYVFVNFFEELIFPQTSNDVLRGLPRDIQNQLVQTGVIPEGRYTIEIEARPASAAQISVIPGIANFSVRYPPPPRLVSPSRGSNVTLDVPVFSWTPVVALRGRQIAYDFLLVEVFEGQTPLQAISGNRAIAETTLINETTLPYTIEFLPLDPGRRYAWQVTANDAIQEIPFQSDGESEIYTFTFKEAEQDPVIDLADLDEIILIPDFAKITGLEGLTANLVSDAYELIGEANLHLDFAGAGEFITEADVNILIQANNLANPILAGGRVNAAADIIENLLPENEWVTFDELNWRFGRNFTLDISLLTPDQHWFSADGEIVVTREGLHGEAEISGDPLASFSHDLLELELTTVGVEYPANRVWADGDARLMGIDSPCELRNLELGDASLAAGLLCNEQFDVPLVSESEFLTMQVNRVLGDIDLFTADGSLVYNAELASTIGMLTTSGRYCGSKSTIALSSSDGFNIERHRSSCPVIDPRIDLGFAELRFENTELRHLSYNPGNSWDFELGFDASLEVPAFNSWSSLTMEGISLTPEGIEFESINFGDNEQRNPLPSFNAELFRLRLQEFVLNQFTFPVFDWDGQAPGPWEIEFEGSAAVQNSRNIPGCLLGTELVATQGRIDQNRVITNLNLENFAGCDWEIGPGYQFQLQDISGVAGLEYPSMDEMQPFGRLYLDGGIELGAPFQCEGGDNRISFSGDDLRLSDGIRGTLEDVIPGCPLAVGPFEAQVTSSSVEFDIGESGRQQAIMHVDAFIDLPNGPTAEGSAIINLMTGRFIDVSFIIDEPFDWYIPSEDIPALTFRLNRAEITRDGFFIDGRHNFRLRESSMGVTFDNFLIDLSTFRVQSGRIIFDEQFAFEVGISDQLDQLTFQSVEPETELMLDPGLLMELAGTVVIDSLGVHTSGSADASVAFGNRNFDSAVTVEYSRDFRISLYPFGVQSGQADFYFRGDKFAYVDPSGFHPVMAFFAEYLVPDRLPLPTEQIAYLQLREDGELLVDVAENEEGNYVLSTIPGSNLSFVVPYIDPDNPPTLANVAINDLTISANPYSPEVISGSVEVDVPADNPVFNLTGRNVPLTIRQIHFGSRMVNGSSITALYMLGNMHLFDQELDGANDVEFYLRGDGFVRANFNLTGMDSRLSIAPGDRVVIGVDELSGNFDMPVGSGSPNYDFSVGGSIEVLTDEGYRAGADLTVRTESGGFFTISDFDGYAFDESPGFGIGNFNLNLEEIVSIPEFSYSTEHGFEFAIELDLDIGIELSGGQRIDFPLNEIEIRHDGISFPGQLVDESSFPGLNLPEIDLLGFGFKPLALNIPSGFTWSWVDGFDISPNLLMNFAVYLPEFEGTPLSPEDGLLFTNVGFDEGFLTGAVDLDLGGIELPIASGDQSPSLLVDGLSVALAKVPSNSYRQAIDFDINGTINNIPAFTVDDPSACPEGAEYSLSIIEGRAFEGSITNLQPCGYLELGPVILEVPNADLNLYLDNDVQMAVLDGSVDVTLPSPGGGQPGTISGQLALDAISGTIHDGSVSITQPFVLNMPYFKDEDPLFTFAINQASLDSQGLTLTGTGNLEKGNVDASVNFDNLIIALPEFYIAGGSATVAAEFSVLFDVMPFGFEIIADGDPMPANNALLMDLDAQVIINEHGLNFTGAAASNLIYEGEQYTNLRVELVDDFAMSISGLSVTRGRAEFYWDEDGVPAAMPIAYIDEDGFHFGAGLLAFLPDRIPLPSEDIAYIIVKDDEGEPLVEVESTESGMLISASDYLSLVVPALPDHAGEDLEIGVSFTLQTDDAYNVTGGSLSLQSNISLQNRLNLPVTLTHLNLDDDDGISLEIGLTFDLPAIFEGHEAALFATLSQNGVESGSFSVGEVSATYDASLEPIYTFDFSGSVPGSGETDTFVANLLGIEATFGSNSVSFAGTLGSSLVLEEDDDPLFFNAQWSSEGWSFLLDPGDTLDDLRLGQAVFSLDDHEGLALVSENDNFYLSVNGQVSFEDILDEPVSITVHDLQVGVTNYSSSPSLHFAIGQAVGDLGDQQFGFFDDAFLINLINPTVTLSGRELALATDGNIQFLNQQIDYTGLEITTAGHFNFNQISAGDIEIFEQYLVLQSIELTNDEGLQLTSDIKVTLPAPVEDYDAVGQLTMYRDESNQIQIDQIGLEFEVNERFDLLNFGEFELTQVAIEINPFDWIDTGVAANGNIYLGDDPDPVIEFGKSNNFPNQPGIGLSYGIGQSINVNYNITGNTSFDFDLHFFNIQIAADISSSASEGFELLLAGEAGMTLPSVDASLSYEGIRVTEEGLVDIGNITGGSIDVASIFSMEVGQFVFKADEAGFMIDLADTQERAPDELQEDGDFDSEEVATTRVEVTEIMCFGPCPEIGMDSDNAGLEISINADGGNESGGLSGGIHRVMFYNSADGRALTVENLHVQLDDFFSMNASLNYVQEGQDILVRAAASASFNLAGESIDAVVAGKFSTIGGQVSYGLFVAVQSDAGIPIVPGVINLTGAGGGFFYRPVQDDLTMVHNAMSRSGVHELVDEDAASIQGEADFAVMLFASVSLGGGGSAAILEGSTFFQITNQSFYMDARASVLGMDGVESIASTNISGTLSASIMRDPFAIIVGIDITVDVPFIIDGTGDVEFFLAGEEGERVWGVIGNVDLTVYRYLNGNATLLAGNPGFMFEATLSVGFDIKIIDFKASLTGAIWIMQDEDYQYPFGAYGVVDVEAKVLKGLVSVDAEAKAIFVTKQGGGYEFFASAYGCGRVLGKSRCGHGWASYSDSDGLDYGRGKGDHVDLVDQARAQQEQFEEHIAQLLAEALQAVDDITMPEQIPLAALTPGVQTYRDAGIAFYDLPFPQRNSWVSQIETAMGAYYSPSISFQIPQIFVSVMDIMRSEGPWIPSDMNASNLKGALEVYAIVLNQTLSSWSDIVVDDILIAVEYTEQAQIAFDNMMMGLEDSPVQYVSQPEPSTNAETGVDFAVDENLAGQQQQSVGEYSEQLRLLNEQFIQNISDISSNLESLDGLLKAESGLFGEMDIVGWMALNAMLMEQFDQYFAALGNEILAKREWATGLRSEISNLEPSLETTINNLRTAYITSINNTGIVGGQNLINSANNFSRQFVQLIQFARILSDEEDTRTTLQSPTASSHVSELYSRVTHPFTDSSSSLGNEYRDAFTNFWIEMNRAGLSAYINAMNQRMVQEVWAVYRDSKIETFETAANFTILLDQFYTTKSNLGGILYNLIDNYLDWRGALDDVEGEIDTNLQSYVNQRDQIAQSLLPPQITEIVVNPNRQDGTFYNETQVEWTATHPVEIIENSIQYNYRVFGEGSTDIYGAQDRYLSVGNRMNHTLYANNFGARTTNVNFGVRVRGSGGNTAIRRASFSVDVDEGGSTTAPGTQVLPEETSPPEEPVIVLPEYNSTSVNGEKRYWTSSSTNVNLLIQGNDPEVGIARFEYSVGTEPGMDNIIEWTQLQGQRRTNSDIPAEEMQGPTLPLDMTPGDEYYINARVENNMGQWSPEVTLNAPLVYDDSVPHSVELQFMGAIFIDNLNHPFFGGSSSTTVHPLIETVPEFNPSFGQIQSWTNTYGVPSVQFTNFSAEEDVSGLSHYQYVLSRSSSDPENLFDSGAFDIHEEGILVIEGEEDDIRFGRTNTPVLDSFQRDVYLHVRPVDNAGNVGETYTFGPHQSIDATRPNSGKLQAKVSGSNVKLYIIDVPYDPESDLLGIQYAIGTSPESGDIRSFPQGNTVDKQWNLTRSQILSGTYDASPSISDMLSFQQSPRSTQINETKRYLSIPAENLPVGENLYIRYRSVNTKGISSTVRATGPFNLDTTPPVVPNVNFTVYESTRKVDAEIGNILDPESGVAKVELWVAQTLFQGTLDGGNFQAYLSPVTDKVEIQSHEGVRHGTFSESGISAAIPDDLELTGLKVVVRITNGAGLTRVRSVDITESDIYSPPLIIIQPFIMPF